MSKQKEITKKKTKYILAVDPKIKQKVLYVIKGKKAISIITGHKIKLGEKTK